MPSLTSVNFGSSDGVVSTMEQAAQLTYSSVVFKESLRMRPSGTILFLHSKVRRANGGRCICGNQKLEGCVKRIAKYLSHESA